MGACVRGVVGSQWLRVWLRVAAWLCDCAAVWLCGCPAVRRCGGATVWLCGCHIAASSPCPQATAAVAACWASTFQPALSDAQCVASASSLPRAASNLKQNAHQPGSWRFDHLDFQRVWENA
eukprot:873527-Prymnesium_polylepis.1